MGENKICAVIPTETFNTMQQRWKEFNTFLFPVPRKNGYEFVMVQFMGNEAHFTTLINYQAHKENAPECLNMIHYTESSQDKKYSRNSLRTLPTLILMIWSKNLTVSPSHN